MQPVDVQGRQVLAAERAAVLRADARPTPGEARGARRRLGVLLVAAGLRLAPDAAPGHDGREAPIADELVHGF